MRFSVASGTDNSLLQLISNSNDDIELHTHETDNNTRPYGIEGLSPIHLQYFGSTVVPHAYTSRGSYTVPANKIARIDLIALSIMRITVPTTNGQVLSDIQITPSGGSTTRLVEVKFIDGLAGGRDALTVAPKMILEVGDEIELFTTDVSIAGTIAYKIGVWLSEIDA